jgi:glucosamine-6-phosphate deaminase
MGISHMLAAKLVLILEFSEGRAKIVRRMVEDPISSDLVVSNFQQHPNVTVVVDIAAASELARFKCPWYESTFVT